MPGTSLEPWSSHCPMAPPDSPRGRKVLSQAGPAGLCGWLVPRHGGHLLGRGTKGTWLGRSGCDHVFCFPPGLGLEGGGLGRPLLAWAPGGRKWQLQGLDGQLSSCTQGLAGCVLVDTCVCMCVLRVQTHVHVCVCLSVSGSMRAHVCRCVCGPCGWSACVCMSVSASACVLVCVQICVCICPCVQMCVCLSLCLSEHAGGSAWVHAGVSVRVPPAHVHLPDLGHEGCTWLVAATAPAFCSAESTRPGGPEGWRAHVGISMRSERQSGHEPLSRLLALPVRRKRGGY